MAPTTTSSRKRLRSFCEDVQDGCTSSSPTESNSLNAASLMNSIQFPLWRRKDKETLSEEFLKTFDFFQAVHLPCEPVADENSKELPRCEEDSSMMEKHSLTWKDVPLLFERLNRHDQDSWCVETENQNICASSSSDLSQMQQILTPEIFWKEELHRRAYCSFLVQHDHEAYRDTLQRLPLQDLWTATSKNLTPATSSKKNLVYEPCIWFFFGWNLPPLQGEDGAIPNGHDNDLQGRPDHTDSVSHDGTWHYQLSGCKRWYLRPSIKLLEHWKLLLLNDIRKQETGSSTIPLISNQELEKWVQEPETAPTLCIACEEGDVIVVNTRLWWHRTVLPPRPVPSVSYARDFRVQDSCGSAVVNDSLRGNEEEQQHAQCLAVGMTNLDGLYATNDIEEGTILFTETDMPDCELHRSAHNWNCHVVELEDGTNAVVSSRPIVAGEFFCAPESEDENSDEESEDSEGEVDE